MINRAVLGANSRRDYRTEENVHHPSREGEKKIIRTKNIRKDGR